MTEHERIGKLRLEEALRRYDTVFYESFPVSKEKISYSDAFLKNMTDIIGSTKPKKHLLVGVLARRAAAVILAVGLIFSGMAGVSAIKKPFADFMIRVYEKFNEVFFCMDDVAKAPETIETVYMPMWLPSGYTLAEQYMTDYEVKLFWDGTNGRKIVFTQMLLDTKSTVDNENSDFDILYISDVRFAIAEKDSKRSFYWNTNDYTYSLIVPSILTMEECVMLIESIDVYEEQGGEE